MGSSSRRYSLPALQIKIGTTLAQAERILILATLSACDGNKSAAADMLGVSLKTIYNKLAQYDQGIGAAKEDDMCHRDPICRRGSPV